MQAADVPNNGLAVPGAGRRSSATCSRFAATRTTTRTNTTSSTGASLSRELPGDINFTVGYTGSQGKDMFLRGVGNVLDPVTRARLVPNYGQIDFKTAGCVDGSDARRGLPDDRLRHGLLRRPAGQRCRAASAPA